ncbi:hypothetical protein O988_03162 [Pseudogymnoascus sp. VKM F-3808]|nr:hypothetical protein O988_03162 [Pseudogymnoascus sp. VKM F-3808]
MQPLHAVFAIAIAFAVTFSNACLVFDAIYNIGTSKITGTMTDNGQKTCTFSGTVEKDKKSSLKMKLLQTLAVVCLFTFSHACLIFAGVFNRNAKTLEGTLTDNGKKTCTFSGEASSTNKFASCIPGFAAYIHPTMFWGSYSNNGHEGRFESQGIRSIKMGGSCLLVELLGARFSHFAKHG